MSKKGEKKTAKALSAPKAVHISRKHNTWTVRTKAGAYKRTDSVSIGIVLRDYIKLATTLKEAKKMLREGEVKINGVARKDYQYGVGLFDIITIEKQEVSFRVLFDAKRRVIVSELKNKSNEKLSRVEYKRTTKKGVQITTNDGRTFINNKASVGDTIQIKVPENKIEAVLVAKEGAIVYITKGTHCAGTGKIKEIVPGSANRKKLVKIEKDGKDFETTMESVFVVGDKDIVLGDLKNL
jgi:small subunit ribosomal protein S4e